MDFGKLTTRRDALKLLLDNWTPSPVRTNLPLKKAKGHVLAEDQYAEHSLPVVRASGMDGIAVAFRDFKDGMPDTSVWQEGREYDRADTGDDFSDIYDTVIPIEWVEFPEEGGIRIEERQPVKAGMNVTGCGSRLKEGSLLMEKGTLLTGRHLSILAMGGVTEVPVIKKPKVAFIPTGSELIPAGTAVSRGENIDSNSILAEGMLEEMGADPVCYPIVKDNRQELGEMLTRALDTCDIVIINAGSSKGKEDFNTQLLRERGTLLCHGVAAVPGRPMGIGVIEGKAVVNLAGPPMAAFYGLDWIIRRLVCEWLNIQVPVRRTLHVTLEADLMAPPQLERLAFLELRKENDMYFARPYGRGESGRLPAMAADALYITRLGEHGHKKGEVIEVELL